MKAWYSRKVKSSVKFNRLMLVIMTLPAFLIGLVVIVVNMLRSGYEEFVEMLGTFANIYREAFAKQLPAPVDRTAEAEDLWSAQ